MSKKVNENFLKQTFVTQTQGYTDVFTKRDIWSQIGKELNGTFRIVHNSGNETEKLILNIPYKNYVINLSESDTRPLKFELDFDSILDYNLVLSWDDAFNKLLKRFGLNNIKIGNEKFDNRYLIKSKDTGKTINFFTSEIITCLLRHNVYSVSFQTDRKNRKAKLLSTVSRTITDKSVIVELIDLHRNMIEKFKDLHIIS
ncbi:MAG: hypothetical protein A2X13_03940 [Bacteroidetes bacterium GWC2_33_15]|nr:MAG: hypothetical protein A2X10_00705 [Bacteroidetes bacterium GWA2_33_15]OFX49675.1 MAG: hypothetical protein A2X13_03940 [Bacteroidetes bacterium GWC2_33_15]OFX65935.1 MAG: hypothetical protein A2X15_10895 [Bacteroidetes bacterium GWB2_32_14]OFX68304.1 MAG: hypothetical protein A2X14_08000 [Bacteroidetes bacterium GWD2_33_33]HAN18087.1 hypothetical protein [Bacteroidales bacterium]